jgi:hypothetical protein
VTRPHPSGALRAVGGRITFAPTTPPDTGTPHVQHADAEQSKGQRAYEERRAQKAGMSYDQWMRAKAQRRAAEQAAAPGQGPAAAPSKRPGLIGRLLGGLRRKG